jgi:hypothetical protein
VGDFNARVGKTHIPNIVGTNGEQLINYNGNWSRDFASYNN